MVSEATRVWSRTRSNSSNAQAATKRRGISRRRPLRRWSICAGLDGGREQPTVSDLSKRPASKLRPQGTRKQEDLPMGGLEKFREATHVNTVELRAAGRSERSPPVCGLR